MLNQHRNLVVPESDWLRVGECLVDVPRREVRCGGESRRITVKALQVLLVLVAHAGKVVSREALLEWVWADTLPTDDVLTQAITQLRKAFADDREAPRYLETIAKGGYRLLAPVEWQVSPEPVVGAPFALPVAAAPGSVVVEETHAPDQTPHAPGSRRIAPLVAAIGVVAVLAGAAWWLRGRPEPASPANASAAPVATGVAPVAAASYQRITSAPGGELWPSLSPDGAQVVYSAWSTDGDQAGLMVQTTAPVPARALTTPPKGVQDTMPMWSPNGREIVFQRLGPGDACALYLIPASGGEPRNISACKRSELASYAWFPDGRRLIGSELGAVKDDDGAVHVLDLDSGTWTRLSYRKAPTDIDLGPVVSPDGRWIAFRRNISLSDVWRMPVTGGEPERLTALRANLFGVAWTPDSSALVISRYQDAGGQLARVDLARRTVRDLDVNGYYPAIAQHGASLAFVVGQTQSAMYRLDATHLDATPQPLFPSTGLDLMPSVSPDGTQIVWMSNRTGRLALWWARPDQPESLRLIDGVVPMPRYTAVWTTDGSRLLVVGRDGARQALYEVQPGSGRVQRLPVPSGDPVHAEYLPDLRQLLVVTDRGSGRLGVTLYDRSRTPWTALAQLEDVAMTRVDLPRHRLLFTRPTTPGLWQADLDLRNVRPVSDKPDVGGGRFLALLPDGPWLARTNSHCGLQWAPLDAKKIDTPCRHPGAMLAGVSYDSTHHQLFYAAERDESPDIGWMPLPDR
jgi:Tol biopolymer transport system component/DNA-binding winged helix-turn-helix (wHTH) protein